MGLSGPVDPGAADSMGLYLVRMLVEQLGGRLSAEAAGGARFGIRFQA